MALPERGKHFFCCGQLSGILWPYPLDVKLIANDSDRL